MFTYKKLTSIQKLLYQTLAEDISQDFQNESLLDVGCGDGTLISYLQRRLNPNVMTGIDFSKKNIRQANKRLTTYSGYVEGRLKFIVGDIQALPVEDNEFDKVISSIALHHFPDVNRSFAEIYRVLKPGGKALIYDFRKEASYEEVYQTMYEWSANKISIFRSWITKKWMQEYWDSYVPKERIINAVQSSKFRSYRLEPFYLKQRPILFKLLLIK